MGCSVARPPWSLRLQGRESPLLVSPTGSVWVAENTDSLGVSQFHSALSNSLYYPFLETKTLWALFRSITFGREVFLPTCPQMIENSQTRRSYADPAAYDLLSPCQSVCQKVIIITLLKKPEGLGNRAKEE